MGSLLAVRALLSRVPGIVWVALLALSFVAAGGYGIYRHGVREGGVRVHRVALRDSVTHAVAVVDTATRKSDRAITIARTDVARSSTGRVHTRAILAAAQDSTPLAVITVVEQQLTQDSTTIALQTAAIDTLCAERLTRAHLDTLREHEVVLKPPDDDNHMMRIAEGVGLVAVVIEAVRLILHLTGR